MDFWIILFVICALNLMTEFFVVKETQIGELYNRKSNKTQRTLNIITIMLLAVVAGLRNVGGSDFNVYRNIYNNIPTLGGFFRDYEVLDDKYMTLGVERLYLFFNSLFKTCGISYYGFIFAHSLFIVFVTYYALRRYTCEFTIVIFIFLYKFYFYNVFISLRQPITMAIFFIMLRYMEKRDWKRYFLLAIICFMFHTAALVLFPLYFLNRLKLSKKLIIILNAIFIPTLILAELNVPVMKLFEPILQLDIFATDELFDKASNLINGESVTAINWLHTAEYFLIMCFVIAFYDDLVKANANAATMIKLFLCLLPVFTLFRNYEILTRIKDYFTLSYGFVLSYLGMIKKGKFREFVYLAVGLWCGFGYFRFITLFDGGDMTKYMPNIFLNRSFFN